MPDPKIIPIVYSKCGHSISVLSPGVSDPAGVFAVEHAETGQPVKVDWNGGKCWNCGDGYRTYVGDATRDALAKAKGLL